MGEKVKKTGYRELTRRRHKLLGCYLALWAWVNKVDCVALHGKDLFRFLGVTKMRWARESWIKEDLQEIFPYTNAMHFPNSGGYASLYLSRKKFPDGFSWWGTMCTAERVRILNEEGLATKVVTLPKEETMAATLALVIQGLRDFPRR